MVTYYYNYTVGSLLHAAGRHRRHDHCYPCQSLQWCQCEDDHVIELRLVVAALNELPKGTYRHFRWQRRLVDFFNAKHKIISACGTTYIGRRLSPWTSGFEGSASVTTRCGGSTRSGISGGRAAISCTVSPNSKSRSPLMFFACRDVFINDTADRNNLSNRHFKIRLTEKQNYCF